MPDQTSYDELAANCVRVDWKSTGDETLYALRNQLGQSYAFLAEPTLDALVENQAGEDMDEQMLALGQEMTVHGFFLYALDEGSDEYCLMLVPLAEAEGFQAWLEGKGQRAELLKQARRKAGSPAKRIKTAGRLEAETFGLSEPHGQPSIRFPGQSLGLLLTRHYSPEGGHTHDTCAWLDFASWPPERRAAEQVFGSVAFSEEHGLWALAHKLDLREGELWLTDSPLKPSFSRRIDFPEISGWREKRAADPTWEYYHVDNFRPLSSLCWMGEDLLISDEVYEQGTKEIRLQVWVVRGAARGGTAVEEIFLTPPKVNHWDSFSRVAVTGGGQRLILLGGRFYFWENGALRDSGLKNQGYVLYPVPTGPHSFAYIDLDAQLLEENLESGRCRRRPLPGLTMKSNAIRLTETITAFVGWSYPSSKNNLALIWDQAEDAWLRLPYGSFGSEGISDILALSASEWILDGGVKLYLIQDMMAQLRAKKSNILEPPAWIEDPPSEPRPRPEPAAAVHPVKPGLWSRLWRRLRGK